MFLQMMNITKWISGFNSLLSLANLLVPSVYGEWNERVKPQSRLGMLTCNIQIMKYERPRESD